MKFSDLNFELIFNIFCFLFKLLILKSVYQNNLEILLFISHPHTNPSNFPILIKLLPIAQLIQNIVHKILGAKYFLLSSEPFLQEKLPPWFYWFLVFPKCQIIFPRNLFWEFPSLRIIPNIFTIEMVKYVEFYFSRIAFVH